MTDTATRIADAAIAVIGRDGFDRVSVRTVAAEAGLAAGSVQHHFGTRDDLIVAAYRRVVERTIDRVRRGPAPASPADALQRGAVQTFPADRVRRHELTVWLALSAAAPSRPALDAAHRAGVAEFRSIVLEVLRSAQTDGTLRDDVDPELEAWRVPALFDGFSLHAISAGPRDRARLARMLEREIDALFA